MAHVIGPKDAALQQMREAKADARKPSKSDLRKQVAKIKPVQRAGKRGR